MSSKEESDIIISSNKKLKTTIKIPVEKKAYLNLYCFKLSYGIIYTYMFIGASMAIKMDLNLNFLYYIFCNTFSYEQIIY